MVIIGRLSKCVFLFDKHLQILSLWRYEPQSTLILFHYTCQNVRMITGLCPEKMFHFIVIKNHQFLLHSLDIVISFSGLFIGT